MVAPTPAKTFIKTQQKTKINGINNTAESTTTALQASKDHPIKNLAIPSIISVLPKPQTPLPTVTATVNPNQQANMSPTLQLIIVTAKTTGVQNQRIATAIPRTITYRAATVQAKQQDKPSGQTAVTKTIPTTATRLKKPPSTNQIPLAVPTTAPHKAAAEATTMMSQNQLGIIPQPTAKPSIATAATFTQKTATTITAVTTTANQTIPPIEILTLSINPNKPTAATVHHTRRTIKATTTQSVKEMTHKVTSTAPKPLAATQIVIQ